MNTSHRLFVSLFALALASLFVTSARAQTIASFTAYPVYEKDGVKLKSATVQVNYSLTATADGLTARAQRTVSFDAADTENPVTIDGITLTPAQWFKFAEAYAARKVPAKKQEEADAKAAAEAAEAAAAAPNP
jgi:hypothetical protein